MTLSTSRQLLRSAERIDSVQRSISIPAAAASGPDRISVYKENSGKGEGERGWREGERERERERERGRESGKGEIED